jgi:DNA modification methylase
MKDTIPVVTTITLQPPESLKPSPNNARNHPKKQIEQLAASFRELGFLGVIVVDEIDTVLAGWGRVLGAKLAELPQVPTVRVTGLSEAKKRAFQLADNKIAEGARWDRKKLRAELAELPSLLLVDGLDLTITGFGLNDFRPVVCDDIETRPDASDRVPPPELVCVTRPGDVWQLGSHRIICANARSAADYTVLLGDEKAHLLFLDPPDEPVTGSTEYLQLLADSFQNCTRGCAESASVIVCCDWRRLEQVFEAGRRQFFDLRHLVVWDKGSTEPAKGALFRQQHRLILHFDYGAGRQSKHEGRALSERGDVWTYARARVARPSRYPFAVMPAALVVDAIRECTREGEIVLDAFLGCGATIVAAEKTGRRAYGLEIEPAYVDVTIRRWQALTRRDACLVGDTRTFREVALLRSGSATR